MYGVKICLLDKKNITSGFCYFSTHTEKITHKAGFFKKILWKVYQAYKIA